MGTTGRPGGVIAGTVTTGTAGSDSGRGREAWGVTAGTTRGEQSGQGRACCVAGAHTDCHRVKAAVPTAPTNVCAERGIVRAEVMGASSMECMESAQARPAAALVQQCGCTQSQQGGVHTVTTGGSAHSHNRGECTQSQQGGVHTVTTGGSARECTQSQQGGVHTVTTGGSAHSHDRGECTQSQISVHV